MNIINTYVVININNIQKLKKIEYFKMNLGLSLTNRENRFQPGDINITKHYTFHNKIINLIGYIGTLPIYTDRMINLNKLQICNEQILYEYDLKNNMYDSINNALSLFFETTGLRKNVITDEPQNKETKKEVYINKPLSEMTLEERIAFTRNNS